MKMISDYIQSGMIELYVLGLTTSAEATEVEKMVIMHDEVRTAVIEFSKTIEQQAFANAIAPDPITKPMLLATINYVNRLEKGEARSFPPMLHQGSQIDEYKEWLVRADLSAPTEHEDVYARIIGYTPEVTTAIVWIKNMAPAEVHTNEFERFLIIEGTCEIIIEEEVYQLVPGDFLTIPLYKKHLVKVTSRIPCKAILQRVAA